MQNDSLSRAPSDDIPLVIDLDGTMTQTDTLHEAILRMITQSPHLALALPNWVRQGRAAVKQKVADRVVLNADGLPINTDVLDYARAAKDAGRSLLLVSAADQRQVDAVTRHLDLFDEGHGTINGRNLKGAEKAAFLVSRFGDKGFDYIGDSNADLPVWQAANTAITVGVSKNLRQTVEQQNNNVEHLTPAKSLWPAIFKAMRPHQWSKNVLLFLPMLAAHDVTELGALLLGFVAFCLTASAVYVMNDLLDLASDRAHPRKCKRPFAAGTLTPVMGAKMAVLLLFAAGALGISTGSMPFMLTLLVYLVSTFAYSLWIKRKLIMDVVMLAGLYTIRIIAGGAVTGLVLSPWILGFSMFLFLALAAVKRQSELMDQLKTGRESAGRAYEVDDLPVLRGAALSAGNAAVLVLALYISSDAVQQLYTTPMLLWLLCPIMLYWVLRMVMMTHRGFMKDDPIVFAASDKISVAVVLSSLLVLIAAAV